MAATPAKKTAEGTPKTRKALSLDQLGELQEVATLPIATRGGDGTSAKLAQVIKASFDSGKVVAFTVPTSDAKTLGFQLHAAAARAGVGVKVRFTELAGGKTQVAFQGKTRSVRAKKES